MSRNVEVAQAWIDRYNERDIDGLLALSDPAIEFRSVFAGLESEGVFSGYAGVQAYFAEIDEAYERFVVVPSQWVDAGAGVLAVAAAAWIGRGSGAKGETEIFAAFWIKSGRVFHEQTYTDRAEAFAALGVDDPQP